MKNLISLLLFAALLPASALSQNVAIHEASTQQGKVSGVLNAAKKVTSFKGIPFAAPPLGELRWKEPQPAKSWSGVRVCDKFSASPMQNNPVPFMMWTEEFIAPPEPVGEDCLYLNVWTSAKSTKEKLPVFVWIYGGGFVSGSSACDIYDGEAMAGNGVVFVSINYRVGIFGFMAHPDLTKESPHSASGNYALMDQIAALKWVKSNITAFGGDPDKVTIGGQSAGSFSVQCLVASPLAKGLFRGAIAQSGASFSRLSAKLADAEKTGSEVSQKMNKAGIEALRELSADSLLQVANTFPFGSFGPIADGYVLPESIRAIFEKKKHNDVALMAGWVTGDAALTGQPKSAADFRTWAATTYGERKDNFLKIFPASSDDEAKQSQSKLGILNFAAFPDHVWALSNTSNSYIYEYSYVPTDKPGFPNYGAFHTSEVPFALHTLALWNRPWVNADFAVEKYMSAYWTNFIKTGNPNGNGLAEWRRYDASEQAIMELGVQPVLKAGMFREEFRFLQVER